MRQYIRALLTKEHDALSFPRRSQFNTAAAHCSCSTSDLYFSVPKFLSRISKAKEMHQSKFLPLSTFFGLLTTLSLALSSSPNHTALLEPLGRGPECYSSGARAPPKDCAIAILKLPQFAEYGAMPRPGIWTRSPQQEFHGACLITVASTGPDRSSWTHISTVASQLLEACTISHGVSSAGSMVTGDNGKIRITIQKHHGRGQ